MAMIATRDQLGSFSRWPEAFSGERKDWRYYEIVEDTLTEPAASFLYLVLPGGAIQPLFVIDQDLLAGSSGAMQSIVRAVRKLLPRFLKMRTLMVGCAAGEGHLADPSVVESLAASLPEIAKNSRASLIVMKEFPARYRSSLEPLRHRGFTRVPSMPMTRLNIGYENFDTFVARKLSKPTRKSIRRKLRAAESADPGIELQVVTDVAPYVDEIYPLYLAVYERSPLHFEKLTKGFLAELGKRMPDKARFFIWRQNGRAIAFSLCLVHNDTIYDEYLGLDYAVAFDLHLYFYTLRDIINWAIEHRLQWYVSSALNYEPKLHLRCDLVPLDLYVAHTSRPVNAILKRVLPLLEPTRNDPVLRRFPNFREVWS